jgi:hypothetical protein
MSVMTTTYDPPARPRHDELLAVLSQACESEPMLAHAPLEEIWWGVQHLDLQNGWQLSIWWVRGELGPLHEAIAPDGRRWVYGCSRWPSWADGPDSTVLDPIQLLSSAQQAALVQRMTGARCWPQSKHWCPMPILDFDSDD